LLKNKYICNHFSNNEYFIIRNKFLKKFKEALNVGKLEDLKRELLASGKSIDDIGEIFTKFGISPDNPDAVKEVLKDAGLQEDLTEDSAAQMVKNMANMLPPEMKKQIAGFVNELLKTIPAGPMPAELVELLNSWQTGGGGSEKIQHNDK